MARHDQPTTIHHVVLRARIGVDYPQGVDRVALEDQIAAAITTAVTELGGTLDLLQLGVAARPDWDQFGPINRITGGPLWDPSPNHDPRTG